MAFRTCRKFYYQDLTSIFLYQNSNFPLHFAICCSLRCALNHLMHILGAFFKDDLSLEGGELAKCGQLLCHTTNNDISPDGGGVKNDLKMWPSFLVSPMLGEKLLNILVLPNSGFSSQYYHTPQNMVSFLQCWPVIGYWCNLQLIFHLIANKKTSSQSRGYCLALVRPLAGKNFGKSSNTEN